SSSQNRVIGNWIGTDVTGLAPLGNGGVGVMITSSNTNTIGGTAPGESNVIAASGGNGIDCDTTLSDRILGNLIGTDATGLHPLGNLGSGIVLRGGQDTVGGTEPGAGNVIAANRGAGIELGVAGAFVDSSRTDNVVQGNLIGTD